ncbi:hypothetical protein IW140_001933 [Coemansia sp. RSA 1813]|nr:hypothetical protein EV178_001585 [Coemansia sp. RSA 1646]KAJ1771649.1 hypothetical protein LPJ74_002204 [Coemansia sp. RSA 1843]KAJ2089951.1 hypothetical protein IW138_003081 [Coemansia sp. RSA 986]KAJ2215268.1 hypothetical protein EV179_002356 [Coemansia sp. RSA 487]KAJ2570979.1 hypothetical protein IW140_001933 [Coemansia sp. RSA 1813]
MSAQVRQVSSLFKIGRWAALGAGLSYGVLHARTLRKDAEIKRIDNEYARKVALIEEAKKKYAEKKAAESGGGSGQSFNFEDPNFDFDKWAKHVESKV